MAETLTTTDLLDKLVREQKTEARNKNPLVPTSRSSRVIFDRLRQRVEYRRLRREAKETLRKTPGMLPYEVLSLVAGRVHEIISEETLNTANGRDFTTLSTRRTVKFLASIFGEQLGPVTTIEHGFGLVSLERQSDHTPLPSPDGIMVDSDLNVTRILEYSLSASKSYFRAKRNRFFQLRRLIPGTFDETRCLFIVPRETFLMYDHNDRFRDVLFMPGPYQYPQFRDGFNRLFPIKDFTDSEQSPPHTANASRRWKTIKGSGLTLPA